jgi:hypothetical protein
MLSIWALDLWHRHQLGVADRLELKHWRERKSEWPRTILNYLALKLFRIVMLLYRFGGETSLIRTILGWSQVHLLAKHTVLIGKFRFVLK